MRTYKNLSEIKQHNKEIGNYYFEAEAINFFNAKIESAVINGNFFIESIRFDNDSPKIYKLLICIDGTIESIAQFDTLKDAKKTAKSLPNQFAHAYKYFTECFNNDKLQEFINKALLEPENSRNKEFSHDTFCGACTYMMVNADKFNDSALKYSTKLFNNQKS